MGEIIHGSEERKSKNIHIEGTERGRATNRLENDQENENRDTTEAKKKVSVG